MPDERDRQLIENGIKKTSAPVYIVFVNNYSDRPTNGLMQNNYNDVGKHSIFSK